MDPRFDHKKIEQEIAEKWYSSGAFKASNKSDKKPFTILLPPPNASGKMHTGNVLMIAIEDLLIRWKRLNGYEVLWVPGTDHAGFETQITFERELKKQNKSRFEYDRNTLYQMIWDFVQKNKGLIEDQIKKMGASVDWSRYTFTLNEQVVSTVYKTFIKLFEDGLVYKDNYLVNYCPKCGTTFADLEIDHIEKKDSLYYIRYPLIDRKEKDPEFVIVATTRPEPIMLDTHLAVNPKDKKRAKLIGRKVANPLTGAVMEIIGDSFVDKNFGTGVVKLTPAHDKNDYNVAKKLGLPIISGLNLDGKMNENAGEFKGLSVFKAREAVLQRLTEKGFIEKIDTEYEHAVSVCYKGGHEIEPMILPNWFIKVDTLKKPALDVVKAGKVSIYPKWRTITYTKWMEEMHDWPISRQVVWGIRIPVWYDIDKNPDLKITFLNSEGKTVDGEIAELLKQYSFEDIEKGLQTLIAPSNATPIVSVAKPSGRCLQETDTFDTWFSSGQWPLVTLGYPDSEDFKYFYPTSVLETGWEIIRLWVSRMIMFGMYMTRDLKHESNFEGKGIPPFDNVYLHGLVRALDGRKMSKSLGNIINPEEYQEQYGTDALRMGLIAGTVNGRDFAFPKDKIIGYRNFANKIWNMARFAKMLAEEARVDSGTDTKGLLCAQILTVKPSAELLKKVSIEDKKMFKAVEKLVGAVTKDIDKYRFADAGDKIYQFMWHEVADVYLEQVKIREDKEVALKSFMHVYKVCLQLLHPFMPFVTEGIWTA